MRQHLFRTIPGIRTSEQQYRWLLTQNLESVPDSFLSLLLEFAGQHNDYYGPLLSSERTFSDLPVLNKELIRTQYARLTSRNPPSPTFTSSSGGSTGLPQTFLQDQRYASWCRTAEMYYYRQILDVDPGAVRKVVLWGSERDTFKQRDLRGKAYNCLTNTIYLNTFKVSQSDWLAYMDQLDAVRPYFVKGYAGSLYQIARLSKAHNRRLYRPHFVYSSAETLQDFMRAEIEEAFGCPVVDFYGSREVGAIAGECLRGRKHIFSFNNRVEVSGPEGRLLVSNLHNYAMPLLRYEIGDTGTMGSGQCPCGSPLPWLSEIKGRITDHFVKADGTLIHGEYFTHLFYFRPWVAEFQVVQTELRAVEINLVASGEVNKTDTREIEDKIRLVLGADCQVAWNLVESIPKTPQGKHLFTRSLVSAP